MKLSQIIIFIIVAASLSFVGVLAVDKKNQRRSDEQIINNLLLNMTQLEKIGQMVLVDKNAIEPEGVTRKLIGGVMSGGGGNPEKNTPGDWHQMVAAYKNAALKWRLAIPILYGVDAVHGNGNVYGAVIFPHNIGLGATRNASLIEDIGKATAEEVKATGANWNFAPVLSIPMDFRWGRVYECFSTNQDVVAELGTGYINGLRSQGVLATAKHFIGEGTESWGTSNDYKLDQGEITMSIEDLRGTQLKPFQAAIMAGSMSIMISRSSFNGKKISADKYLLTDLLKNELGFKGFLVSDWGAIDQIRGDYYQDIVTSINAGMDMVMLPTDYDLFIDKISVAIDKGDIRQERIDDAVTRILRAKISIGLFDDAVDSSELVNNIGSIKHREVARQAVRESLVLLKNEKEALPIRNQKRILIVGRAANDIGMQAGGWTIEWQGGHGDTTPGTSILEAFKNEFKDSEVIYDPMATGKESIKAEVGVVVVGEQPYAEGVGDRERLLLSPEDLKRIQTAKKNSDKVVLVVLAGRPLIIREVLNDVDAAVMALLPGTEGAGITDVLSGKYNFSGKLPLSWPKTMEQVEKKDTRDPLFEFGFGLSYHN